MLLVCCRTHNQGFWCFFGLCFGDKYYFNVVLFRISSLRSTRSTKLTVDVGSQQSVCAASGLQGPSAATTGCPSHHSTTSGCPAQLSPSYSHISTASFCLSADDYEDTTLRTQGLKQYMEISPKPQGQT